MMENFVINLVWFTIAVVLACGCVGLVTAIAMVIKSAVDWWSDK